MGGAADPDAEFTGKYEEAGRIGGYLLDQFYGAVEDMIAPALETAGVVLEVGCGAGFSTQRLRKVIPSEATFIGSDIGTTLLQKARNRNPETSFVRHSAYSLPLPDKSIDVLVMLEVLEHLEDPSLALKELQRVCRGSTVISVPREPIWRALNMCRGKYLADWGNTPGHVNHWSTRGLMREVNPWFEVADVRQPLPWTVLLLRPRS